MSMHPADHKGRQATGSILDDIPSPDEIRRRMGTNAQENRILRSLFRIARRIEQERQANLAAKTKGVADDT